MQQSVCTLIICRVDIFLPHQCHIHLQLVCIRQNQLAHSGVVSSKFCIWSRNRGIFSSFFFSILHLNRHIFAQMDTNKLIFVSANHYHTEVDVVFYSFPFHCEWTALLRPLCIHTGSSRLWLNTEKICIILYTQWVESSFTWHSADSMNSFAALKSIFPPFCVADESNSTKKK